jgi:peroxiredoxin
MDSVVQIGQHVPNFDLLDLTGVVYNLSKRRDQIIILVFWSASCPWSAYGDDVIAAWDDAFGQHVEVWRIASNVTEKRSDIEEAVKARDLGIVLLDPEHHIADLYGAVTTPQAFVIDAAGILQYAGAIDDATFRRRTPSRQYLAEAIAAILEYRQPDTPLTPGYGYTIVRRVA